MGLLANGIDGGSNRQGIGRRNFWAECHAHCILRPQFCFHDCMPTRSARTTDVFLLLVVLIWGANFPIIKWALAAMPPHAVNVFRFVVSAAMLGGLYAWERRGTTTAFFAPMRTHGRQLVTLGIVGYVLYQVCFIIGVNHTTAGSAALIMASSPLWTALIGRFSGQEALARGSWAGLVVSLVGTALVVAAGPSTVGVGSLWGNALMLAAAVLWGAYTAYNKRVVDDVSPTGATFMGILVALPLLIAIGLPDLPHVAWQAVDVWVWVAIVFSGGLSTGIAFVIWNTAVKDVGASNTAIYGNLVPFVALLGGFLFLDEPVRWPQLVGGLLIIGGLLLVRRNRRGALAS